MNLHFLLCSFLRTEPDIKGYLSVRHHFLKPSFGRRCCRKLKASPGARSKTRFQLCVSCRSQQMCRYRRRRYFYFEYPRLMHGQRLSCPKERVFIFAVPASIVPTSREKEGGETLPPLSICRFCLLLKNGNVRLLQTVLVGKTRKGSVLRTHATTHTYKRRNPEV